jgi:hypothetical protein
MASSDETEVGVSSRFLTMPINGTGRVGALAGRQVGRKATDQARALGRPGSPTRPS